MSAKQPPKPLTPLFARRLSSDGWVYDDKTEHAFALACSVWGFSLVAFDDFLEATDWSTPGAQANLKYFLKRRSEAIAAFTGKNLRLMRAIIEGLATQQELIQTDAALRPKAKHGSKFVGRKPGAGGPVRAAIAKILKANPKYKTEEIWQKLEDHPPRAMEFHGEGQDRHIWTDGHGATGWHQFQTLVSEEKAKLRR